MEVRTYVCMYTLQDGAQQGPERGPKEARQRPGLSPLFLFCLFPSIPHCFPFHDSISSCSISSSFPTSFTASSSAILLPLFLLPCFPHCFPFHYFPSSCSLSSSFPASLTASSSMIPILLFPLFLFPCFPHCFRFHDSLSSFSLSSSFPSSSLIPLAWSGCLPLFLPPYGIVDEHDLKTQRFKEQKRKS